jgi:hypothetical protein
MVTAIPVLHRHELWQKGHDALQQQDQQRQDKPFLDIAISQAACDEALCMREGDADSTATGAKPTDHCPPLLDFDQEFSNKKGKDEDTPEWTKNAMHQDEKSGYDALRRQREQLLQQRRQLREAETDISRQLALITNKVRMARIIAQGGDGSEKRKSDTTQEYSGDDWKYPDLSGGIHHAENKAEASGSTDPHRQGDRSYHVPQCVPGCKWERRHGVLVLRVTPTWAATA